MTNFKNVLIVLSGLVFASSCEQSKPTDNPELLKKVVVGYFDGVSDKRL
jgi:hypothetical protein